MGGGIIDGRETRPARWMAVIRLLGAWSVGKL